MHDPAAAMCDVAAHLAPDAAPAAAPAAAAEAEADAAESPPAALPKLHKDMSMDALETWSQAATCGSRNVGSRNVTIVIEVCPLHGGAYLPTYSEPQFTIV